MPRPTWGVDVDVDGAVAVTAGGAGQEADRSRPRCLPPPAGSRRGPAARSDTGAVQSVTVHTLGPGIMHAVTLLTWVCR
ncbi:MAG: hypothetical protein JWR62_2560 [Modestobacter sp.]|nr:hypothetical protein [Modestobacter sp.]